MREKKNKKHWKTAAYWICIAVSIAFIVIGNRIAVSGMGYLEKNKSDEPTKAKVIRVYTTNKSEIDLGGGTMMDHREIVFEAEFISGERKGEVVLASQFNDEFTRMKDVEPSDKVLLYPSTDESASAPWTMGDYLRTDWLMILAGAFLFLLVLFGQKKGVNTVLSLTLTGMAVFLVFIPSVLSGFNIYASSILICAYVILMTLAIVGGFNRKSAAAAMGCFSGVLISGLLTVIMDGLLNLNGMTDEHSFYLLNINQDNPIDLKAIVFAAIIIGAMGAIMDVSISIASSLWELFEQVENPSASQLIRSGFAIGRDMMGTMSNTLILAYIGSSLSLVLLLMAYSPPLLSLLNREMIVAEILQTLVGSIGILCTIPMTSFICAFMYTKKRLYRNKNEESVLENAFDDDEKII